MDILERDLVYRVVGCAMSVLNELGHGLHEKTYERALGIELEDEGLAYVKQPSFPVEYKGRKIDVFQPDIVVCDRVIIELKAVSGLAPEHKGQVINYLRVTGLHVGLLMNFGKPSLEWERIVLERAMNHSR